MADGKEFPLKIVLSTVDKATAGINAWNKRLDEATRPTREFGKALAGLKEKSGVSAVLDGFKGVGGAVTDLLGKIALIGGAIGLAVHGLLGLVEEFDNLGDTATKLDVTVDFLASMRNAAELSGASVESLDNGITAFGASMGQLRAGGGRMLKFLSSVSPELVTQLKATKGNEAAFRLLADAMAKVVDPQKRLALAQKTFGDTSLVPMLARGSEGLLELQGEFAATAGSLEEAADKAGATDDALKHLKAATTGVKAALLSGLAPALTVVIDQMKEWLSSHRDDIKKWAADIGKKLPAAVDAVVGAVKGAIGWATSFVDSIGGIKAAAILLGVALVGPVLASFVTLGIAIMATPVGWIIAAFVAVATAVAAAVYLIIRHWDKISAFFGFLWAGVKKIFSAFVGWLVEGFLTFTPIGLIVDNWQPISEFFGTLWDGITSVFSAAWDVIKTIVDKVIGAVDAVIGAAKSLNPFSGDGVITTIARPIISQDRLSGAAGGRSSAAKITVDFANAPRGTRVSADPRSTADVDMSVGYQMGGAF